MKIGTAAGAARNVVNAFMRFGVCCLRKLTHFSLFSGIAGIDIAAEKAGFTTVGQCELSDYPFSVLEKRFPNVQKWRDIKDVTDESVRNRGIGEITLISGGFPCQDLSVAGKQKGLKGERSGLWSEMLRVISELRPRFVLAENVRGAVNLALDTVKMGMEGEGYKVWPFVIPASAFGAPHKRERLFVVGIRGDVADSYIKGLQGRECRIMQECSSERAIRKGGTCTDGLMWPTPTINGNYNKKGISKNSGDGLATVVRLWPAPKAQNANSPGLHGDGGLDLQTKVAMNQEGSLNADWVEGLMGFPLGWTNLEVDEPEPFPGWPAPMGMKMFVTPAAWDCQGASGGGMGRSLRTDIYNIKNGLTEAGQFHYEPPRVIKGQKERANRIKCLGNAVVPQQVYPILKAIAEMERCL